MSQKTFIFIPNIPFSNENKTREEILKSLNERYPKGEFDLSNIIISQKDNRYNAYVQISEEHEQQLLELKSIEIRDQKLPVKKCFPHHQIYINKLPDNINKQQIQKHFGQFGKIVSIQLLPAQGSYESIKQKSNINHCYIRYQKNQDAEKCLFSEDRHSIKNKDDIRVVRAYKVGQNDQTDKKLFLKIAPIVQFDTNKLEKELYNYFCKFGQLREKIRIQQLNNTSSRACITFTSYQAGDKALQNFDLNKIQQYALDLKPYASKQSYMIFVGSLRPDVNEQKLRSALQKYGKIVNCTLNPSKKPGVINAVVTFSEEKGFKSALAQYKSDKDLLPLFAYKPYMDIHMNASLRNQYNNFNRKNKKQIDNPIMNMGGIGVGYGMPPRMNQPQGFMGMNPTLGGFNPNMGLGLQQPLGNNPRIPPPPQNYRPPL